MNNEATMLIDEKLDILVESGTFFESVSDTFNEYTTNTEIIFLHQALLQWYETEISNLTPFRVEPLYPHEFDMLIELQNDKSLHPDELRLKKIKWMNTAYSLKRTNLFLNEILLCEKPVIIYHRIHGYLNQLPDFYHTNFGYSPMTRLNWLCTFHRLIYLLYERKALNTFLYKMESGIWRKNYHDFIQSLYIR